MIPSTCSNLLRVSWDQSITWSDLGTHAYSIVDHSGETYLNLQLVAEEQREARENLRVMTGKKEIDIDVTSHGRCGYQQSYMLMSEARMA